MGRPFADHRGISRQVHDISIRNFTFLLQLHENLQKLWTSDDPATRIDAFVHPLFCHPGIVDENYRPILAGLTMVGRVHEGNQWLEADRLPHLHEVVGHFLKRFLQELRKAIPSEWPTLSDNSLQLQPHAESTHRCFLHTSNLSYQQIYEYCHRGYQRCRTVGRFLNWQQSQMLQMGVRIGLDANYLFS